MFLRASSPKTSPQPRLKTVAPQQNSSSPMVPKDSPAASSSRTVLAAKWLRAGMRSAVHPTK